MSATTRGATADDVASWIELIPDAERLFGPMPEFESHLLRGIYRGTAVVVADPIEVIGACCSAVMERRITSTGCMCGSLDGGRGSGAALLEAVLHRWPSGIVKVVTFTADLPGGRAARTLYEKFGFVCSGLTKPAPDGAEGPVRTSSLIGRSLNVLRTRVPSREGLARATVGTSI